MTNKNNPIRRALAMLVAITVFVAAVPFTGLLAAADSAVNYTTKADASTAQSFESMLGTDKDGNRYAGRVWVDKSVFTADAVNLDGISITNDEDFLTVYSALGSSATVTTVENGSSQLDVVFVLDASNSMSTNDRLRRVVSAANGLLKGLSGGDNRIAVVTYNSSTTTVVPLAEYGDLSLTVTTTSGRNGRTGVTAKDGTATVGQTGYQSSGTGTQLGINRGLEILQQNAVSGRTPILIVLTDGEANMASRDKWMDVNSSNSFSSYYGGTTQGVVLSTLLNASYMKSAVEKAYGRSAMVYTISAEIGNDQQANTFAIMDPAGYFTATSTSSAGKAAYTWYTTWARSNNSYSAQDSSRVSWTFPQLAVDAAGNVTNRYGVTKENVMDNIYYVDQHYAANNTAELEEAFGDILTTITTPAFIPTVDTVVQGDATSTVPITYVDFLGEYMELKALKAVTLFGKQYAVAKGADSVSYAYGDVTTQTTVTRYTVGAGSAQVEHPTLGTLFSVSDAVWMELTSEVTGTVDAASGAFTATAIPVQTLRVFIKSAALPVILEAVTVDADGSIRYAETLADPVRVYYTVGVADAVCDDEGNVDLSLVDEAYKAANTVDGKVQFYANRYGVMNKPVSGTVTNGDAHVSFTPSAENRYYFHQNSNAVFYDVKDADGNPLVAEENEYGIHYTAHMADYRYEYMDADHIFAWENGKLVEKALADDHPLYTYIEYYHPTAGGAGEKVYLLAFATWGELKNSLTAVKLTGETTTGNQALFEYVWDENTVVTVEQLRAYIEANYAPGSDLTQIRARIAGQSQRIYRLHHMIEAKDENTTGTAVNAYAPDYNEDAVHVGGIVVWLGNNGVLSVTRDVGITISKLVTAALDGAPDTFTFTVTGSGADSGAAVTLRHTDAAGTVTKTKAAFSGTTLTVTLKAGEQVQVLGLIDGAAYTVTEAENAYYTASVNGKDAGTAVLTASTEFPAAAFVNTPKQFGNLTVSKDVVHPYGTEYTLPADLKFILDTQLTLNGKPVANKTFAAVHTGDSSVTSVTTDENGVVRMLLADGEQVEIFGLEAGTVANGTEYYFDGTAYYTYGQAEGKWYPGFSKPVYWDEDDTPNDDQVVIVANKTVAAAAVNVYSPAGVSTTITLEGEKTVNGGWPAGVSFAFILQAWDAATKTWTDVEQVNVTDSSPVIRFEELFSYTEVGTYSYQVVEVAGGAPGVTYDPTRHTFSVTVTDADFDGKLEIAGVIADHDKQPFAEANGNFTNTDIDFTNYYSSAPAVAVVDIQKALKNPAGSDRVSLEGFEFALYDGDTLVAESGYTDAAGGAQLVWNIENVGTYTYTLKERRTYLGKTVAGMNYAGDITVTVTVTDNGDGTKSAAVSSPALTNGVIAVENTYTLTPITAVPVVSKVLVGGTLQADEFTFLLKQVRVSADLSYVIAKEGVTATNGANGKVAFPTVTFDKAGIYYFEISEIAGNRPGVLYDTKVYHVAVTVFDNGDGTLQAQQFIYDYPDNTAVAFTNTYAAQADTLVIEAHKTLSGKALAAGEFLFALTPDADPAGAITATNGADGKITFAALTFDKAGVYTYTLSEVNTHRGEITYDASTYKITVTVTDDRSGQLSAAVTKVENAAGQAVAYADIRFHNGYAATGSVTLNGQKYLDGGALSADDFQFTLYASDAAKTKGALLGTAKNAADGGFRFVLDYTEQDVGTHYYLVEESSDVQDRVVGDQILEFDARQYFVTVTVTDNGDGTVAAEPVITDPATGNTYTRLVFVNTLTDVLVKDVYTETDADISIDGQSVSVGDVLHYSISYYNGYGNPADVTITDAIPNGTSYVADSATLGGVYANGVLTWTLTVPAGETVTVDFSVTVKDSGADIANQATAVEGNNRYTSNAVENYTYEKTVSSNNAYKGEELNYTIQYTNKTGAVADIVIADALADALTFVAADNGGTYDAATHTVTWRFDGMAAGETVIVRFSAKVSPDAAGAIENTAVVYENDVTVKTNTVTTEILTPELSVVKQQAVGDGAPTADRQAVVEGDTVTYLITVSNSGNGAATDVTVTDTLPAGLVVGEITGDGVLKDGVVTWNFASVAAGETVTVSVTVTVPEVDADTAWKNVATVVYDKDGDGDDDTDESNEVEIEVDALPELVFRKSQAVNGGDATAEVLKAVEGDTVTYYLTVTNVGKDTARAVTVLDTVPAGLIPGTVHNGGVLKDGVITWAVDSVAAGESVTVSFTVTVPALDEDTTWKNVASVVYDKDGDGEDDTDETNEVELDGEDTPEEPGGSPETGDTTQLALWIAVCFVSGGVLTLSATARKKEQNDN